MFRDFKIQRTHVVENPPSDLSYICWNANLLRGLTLEKQVKIRTTEMTTVYYFIPRVLWITVKKSSSRVLNTKICSSYEFEKYTEGNKADFELFDFMVDFKY